MNSWSSVIMTASFGVFRKYCRNGMLCHTFHELRGTEYLEIHFAGWERKSRIQLKEEADHPAQRELTL